jgi:flotillin
MGMFFLTLILLVSVFVMVVASQYKRCPSDRILVIYGKVSGNHAAKCIHGGGAIIIPLIQDYAFLSLEPLTIDLELTGALSKRNIRVNVPCTFTVGVSTQPAIMGNAAERLLSLTEDQIRSQARDIILGQLRLVIATLAIEEINQDREKFLDLIHKNVHVELNKIGLEVINVNIRDITDESGYIAAIGKKAAAEAINKARVEVAQQEREGSVGEALAVREREVGVATELAQTLVGQKKAEADRRIQVSKFEAEGIAGEAQAKRLQEVALAEEAARAEQGRKAAEREKRVVLADYEAEAIGGENEAQAKIAQSNASLAEKRAESLRRGEVAKVKAECDVLVAERLKELARMERDELAAREIAKKKRELDAEAEAEEIRRIAKGQADATLMKANAEAQSIRQILLEKAKGYEALLETSKQDQKLIPTLLLLEKLPELVEQQVKAVQALKIDKITVWDGGSSKEGNGNTTTQFLRSMIGSLPAMHELAEQVGLELPAVLGKVSTSSDADQTSKGA